MRSVFYAAAYARTSKDDSDSSSIENQIELIRGFVGEKADIEIVSQREDCGFSGIDFLRPDFTEMMKDIEAGKVNCVVVKDLSRLGRNYIEVGELMDEIFPRYNVRLIAITDNYDSLNPRSDADEILIPFRNLINEQQLRDISGKIRASLVTKRKNGDFVGAFAPYGYKRDEGSKHQLIVDEHAAEVVRSIFRCKIEGMSQQKIADRLNELGEPSPAEYKKRDTKYVAQFQKKLRAQWSAKAIGRILQNPVYIGVLVQGKQTTPNYKVKRRIDRAENEWDVINEAHEPIVSKRDFDVVNGILRQDTRTSPVKELVYPLSGMLFCGDCGNSMTRTRSDNFHYYVCASSRTKNKTCTTHCIQDNKLSNAIMHTISSQIACALEIEREIAVIRSLPSKLTSAGNLTAQLADREQEIRSCENYKRSLYEDYRDGLISKEDYILFGKDYSARIKELKIATAKIQEEIELLVGDYSTSAAYEWLNHFTQYKSVQSLSRQLVVNLIERIDVFIGKRIEIKFRYNDKLKLAWETVRNFDYCEAGGVLDAAN